MGPGLIVHWWTARGPPLDVNICACGSQKFKVLLSAFYVESNEIQNENSFEIQKKSQSWGIKETSHVRAANTHTTRRRGRVGQRPPTPMGIPCVPTDAATDAAPIDSSPTKTNFGLRCRVFNQLIFVSTFGQEISASWHVIQLINYLNS